MRAFGYILGWIGLGFIVIEILLVKTQIPDYHETDHAIVFWALVSPILLWRCRPRRHA
jgi:hypothetical protein